MSVITNKHAPGRRSGGRSIVLHWPEAIIALGLWLTVAWTILLGYGAFKLIALAI